jgi:hypothetical protein
MPNVPNKSRIIDVRSPRYTNDSLYWNEWRECYNGGAEYLRLYLTKFSERETDADFTTRKSNTPVPAYAKSALNDVRNSIFQRLRDVIRRGGSGDYMKAVAGEDGGVDNNGSSMQSFIGIEVLTEALIMGRSGVYIDAPQSDGPTLADVKDSRPYVYNYCVEDILALSVSKPSRPGEFSAVLLRDVGVDYNSMLNYGVQLPVGTYTRYRLVWLNEETGKVNMMFYDDQNNPITPQGDLTTPDNVIELNLTSIPFVLVDTGGSILKDVCNHQKALLNLGSSDVAYALKANYPFYVEQKDMRAVGSHLKSHISDDGSSDTTRNEEAGTQTRAGVTHGREYDLKAEAPQFIHPSPEPLLASIKLQEKLEDDIRKLVNLSVQNKLGQRVTSAEAMKLSDQGLEAGLSYIGLVLEGAERRIAYHWAAYENSNSKKRQVAVIKYPDRYSLKNDEDRIKEANDLAKLMYSVPGTTVKKELAKNIVNALLAGRVSVDKLDDIYKEIDKADYTTSDPDTIIQSQEAGLVGEQTASEALGFGPEEYKKARVDHAARAIRILQAQTSAQDAPGTEPKQQPGQARGLDDLGTDKGQGKDERAAATDTEMSADKRKPQRGQGKSLSKGDD